MYEAQRTVYRQLKADQQLIDQAAAQLRHQAIADAYQGAENKHMAFAMASVLDELARHLRRLNEPVRTRTLEACRQILGGDVINTLGATTCARCNGAGDQSDQTPCGVPTAPRPAWTTDPRLEAQERAVLRQEDLSGPVGCRMTVWATSPPCSTG